MRRVHAPRLLFVGCVLALPVFGVTGIAPVRAGEPTPPNQGGDRVRKLTPAPAPSGPPVGPEKGTLLLCSLNSRDVRARFLTLAGGADAKVVVVVNRIPPGADPAAASASAARAWGVRQVTAWHAADRQTAEAEPFLTALRTATGVWFTGGRPALYADPYVGSAAHREFRAVLDRGGAIGGESAGALIQSTHFALPPDPQQAVGPFEAFGFMRNVTVFPHLAGEKGKFPLQFCRKFVAANPGLLGLGLDDSAGVVLRGRDAEVIGKGQVTVIAAAAGGEASVTTYQGGERFQLSPESPTAPGK